MSETETLISGLEDLRRSFEDLEFELPADSFGDATEQTVDEIYSLYQKVATRVAASLKWLRQKDAYLAGIEDRMKRRIANAEYAKKEDEVQGFLEAALAHEVLYFRLAAAMAYLKYCFSLTFKNHEEARAMLADLEERKLLVEAAGGPISIGYKKYKLGDFGFAQEDAEEIEGKITAFSRKFMALEKQRRHEESQSMQEDSNINMDGLWGDKHGRCFMQVPPECYEDRDGNTKWRSGGAMVVQATYKEVFPISATGGIEPIVNSMREAHIRLPRHCLQWKNPPGEGKSFSRVRDEIMRRQDVTEDEAQKRVNLMKVFWYLIHRAFKALDAKEKLGELKEEFRNRQNIEPEQFLGLNGSDAPQFGTACVEYEGAFKDSGGPTVYDMFFLVERAEEDGRSVISIVDMPPHAAEILGKLSGKKFSEGENFRELPAVLRRVLQAIKGRMELASEIAKA